jgi:hypothetical protein
MITAILIATAAWFISAAILFFNPIVDKIYASQEAYPGVRALPKTPSTIGKILLAIVIQCVLWAIIFELINDSLPETLYGKTLVFGTIIFVMKMIPRDIDRLLLTTYPIKRMGIEFIIGGICAYVVAYVFAWFI